MGQKYRRQLCVHERIKSHFSKVRFSAFVFAVKAVGHRFRATLQEPSAQFENRQPKKKNKQTRFNAL